MRIRTLPSIFFIGILILVIGCQNQSKQTPSPKPPIPTQNTELIYPWLEVGLSDETLSERFSPPPGFQRVDVDPYSYQEWLRHLPLKHEGASVLSYKGDVIIPGNQRFLAGVIEIDVGSKDLQQCADFIIRLHAEYSWIYGDRDSIYFQFTSGDTLFWSEWRNGYRPIVLGDWVKLAKAARLDSSHNNFRRYLNKVFNYAGTKSISKYAQQVPKENIMAGDYFVQAGSPGHSVIILDIVEDDDGRKQFLIGQGFMPAQSFHILRSAGGSVWFKPDSVGVKTPFWDRFTWLQLRRIVL
ncbi:MAG: DUF4846 domain-containing protein [Candidatus Hatepunaea meridiana]|nr:DUF4846 domain-containing protein [Candidatus Hatepunaea meridiana]